MLLPLLFDFFSGRAKTKVYSTFLGWALISHIDILFIAFLTDQALVFEKTNQLKGEYVWSYITAHGWLTILIEIIRLTIATSMTYLMIWVIPKYMSERSYKQELEIEYILRKMKVDKEEALNKRERKAVKQQLENLKSEKKAVAERAKLEETPEHVKWDTEFDNFIQTKNGADTLREISNTVYAEGGNLGQYKGADGWLHTPTGVKPDNLAMADTNDLVSISDKGKLLALTEKGKYFVKRLVNS